MGKKARKKPTDKQEIIKTLGEVGSDAERALTDLDGVLTAVRAIVDLTLADGGAEEGPVLYKRLNALEFLLKQSIHVFGGFSTERHKKLDAIDILLSALDTEVRELLSQSPAARNTSP